MKEFLEEILVENADMSLHGKVQEYRGCGQNLGLNCYS